ncbi:MAG: hypothetical protein GY944_10330 [bacterium]|nr:hypothetical protein [bacterium]
MTRWLVCIVAWLFLVPAQAAAAEDTLGDFEDAANERGDEDAAHERATGAWTETSDDDELEGDALGAFLTLPAAFVAAALSGYDEYETRGAGEPVAALVRLESGYQRLSHGDVDAYTLRGELIWAFVGLGAEFVNYREGSPRQSLALTNIEGLLRLIPHERLHISISGGVRLLDGKRNKTAGQGGVTFGAYPFQWLGLEADLRWADFGKNVLEDYRAGLLLRLPDFPFAALRGGYRTIRVRGDSLHGGEVGVVLTW